MKNFIKLIKQVHEESYMKVLTKIVENNIPVAFLSVAPIAQTINIVNDLRAQGLNIAALITVDNNPPPDIVHVKKAGYIYPQPEYIFTNDLVAARVALKNFSTSKVLSLNKGGTEHIYEMFMTHLPELQEVYESLIDEESKKTFRGYWLANISNQLGKIIYSNAAHYLINGFIPAHGAIVIDAGVFDGGLVF